MVKYIYLFLLLCWSAQVCGAEITLYLNSGIIEDEDASIAWTSLNTSEVLVAGSERVHLSNGESLVLDIVNTTADEFTFSVENMVNSTLVILPFETQSITLQDFTDNAVYRYLINEVAAAYTGASGLIVVGFDQDQSFYWNLFDLNVELSTEFATGNTSEYPLDYTPEYFWINGNRYPDTLEDSDAMVAGNLGDTLYIHILNSGFMDHVMHFHGFHVEVLYANIQSERIGWSKDTVPVKRGETMSLKLIANQPGVYPVHDHNLIAVTNAGLYPGGMITHIHIVE